MTIVAGHRWPSLAIDGHRKAHKRDTLKAVTGVGVCHMPYIVTGVGVCHMPYIVTGVGVCHMPYIVTGARHD